jgi:phosphoglycolate phosphatase-like HAD superfamily hydrolase
VSAPRLVLFDIDGTLLSAGGVSGRSLADALVSVFGTAGPVESYDFSGKTDPQIVRELMRSAGFDDATTDARMAETLGLYERRLTSRMRPGDVRAKPGVARLLAALRAHARATLGLLTGNLEPCARAKLEPLGFNPHFPFGAYGSDHEDRARLPAVAVARAHDATGIRFEGKSVVIVGDSVHDLRCGRSLGVRAVAVATGRTPADVLAREAPDALLPDCSDVDAALAAVLG